MKIGQNENWSKLNVVKMKSGDKCYKFRVVEMKSSQNGKW